MAVVGIATYLITWSLQRMVQGWQSLYKPRRAKILVRTSELLKSSSWKKRAEQLDRFEPDRRDTKPTEWYTLMAVLHLLRYGAIQFLWKAFRSVLGVASQAQTYNTNSNIQDATRPTISPTKDKSIIRLTDDPSKVQVQPPQLAEPEDLACARNRQSRIFRIARPDPITSYSKTFPNTPLVTLPSLVPDTITQQLEQESNSNDDASLHASVSRSQTSSKTPSRNMFRGIVTKLREGRHKKRGPKNGSLQEVV